MFLKVWAATPPTLAVMTQACTATPPARPAPSMAQKPNDYELYSNPWKGLERQNMAEQVQNPIVNFFARFQYVSIIFEPASSKESFYQPINPLTLKSVFLWNHRTSSINSFTSSRCSCWAWFKACSGGDTKKDSEVIS
jgi:hypothetical protein